LLRNDVRSLKSRISGCNCLAAGEGADTQNACCGVSASYVNPTNVHVKSICDDFRKRSFCALSLGRSARDNNDIAGRSDTDSDAFERPSASQFDIIGEANPAKVSLLHADFSAFGKGIPVGGLQSLPLTFRIVSTIISHRIPVSHLDGDGVGHLLRRNQIAPSDFDPIELETVGDKVEHSFDNEGALWPSCA